MYMQDHDDNLFELIPGGWSNSAGRAGEPSIWMGVLQPYIKNTNVYRCTSSSIPQVDITYAGRTTPSIGMNSFLGFYFNHWYYYKQFQK